MTAVENPTRTQYSVYYKTARVGAFRLVGPDYRGYGQSSMPDHTAFQYSFENYAKLIDGVRGSNWTDGLFNVRHGLRRAHWLPAGAAASVAVQALIVQNGNACGEGLLKFWDPSKRNGQIRLRKPKCAVLPG